MGCGAWTGAAAGALFASEFAAGVLYAASEEDVLVALLKVVATVGGSASLVALTWAGIEWVLDKLSFPRPEWKRWRNPGPGGNRVHRPTSP
jgi:hypothetical protein